MDKAEMRDVLSMRLYVELQIHKHTTLQKSKEEIYQSAYRIEILANLYELLLEEMESMDEDIMCILLYQEFSILDFLYYEWLTREDGAYGELRNYVGEELTAISRMKLIAEGKEEEDATETGYDQAA